MNCSVLKKPINPRHSVKTTDGYDIDHTLYKLVTFELSQGLLSLVQVQETYEFLVQYAKKMVDYVTMLKKYTQHTSIKPGLVLTLVIKLEDQYSTSILGKGRTALTKSEHLEIQREVYEELCKEQSLDLHAVKLRTKFNSKENYALRKQYLKGVQQSYKGVPNDLVYENLY